MAALCPWRRLLLQPISMATRTPGTIRGCPSLFSTSGRVSVLAVQAAGLTGRRETCNVCLLVTGAFALAGSPLPVAGNAIDFWSLYQNSAGWLEVPSATAPPSQRGLPMPGDIMVWYDPPPLVGHVAIVVGVNPPLVGHNGSVTFAEANGPGSIVTQTLLPDLSVVTWSNPIPYSVLGYIRPAPIKGTGMHP